LNAHGEPLAKIESCAGRTITNVTFDGPGQRTLFITDSSTGSVLRADWNAHRAFVATRPA
jgi:gluconolactonase